MLGAAGRPDRSAGRPASPARPLRLSFLRDGVFCRPIVASSRAPCEGRSLPVSELSPVLEGLDFGEGPRWHDGLLWFSDFYRHGVYTVDSEGNEQLRVALDDRPSGLGWMPDGTLLVVAMTSRKLLAVSADGLVGEHADLSDVADYHCNDMVVAADGTAYVGNFGFDSESRAEFRTARLARVTPDGTVHCAAEDLWFPNGSVITADGATLVVGETFAGRYTAFDIAEDGSLANRRTWAEIASSTPDGCCLDAEGAIWMADFVGGRVARVLEGGEVTDSIPVEQRAVACMLGGEDRRTLYVLQSPSADPADLAGRGLSSISAVRVDVPGSGLP